MAIEIVSRSFKNLFRNETTSYLLGMVNETIEATFIVNISWSCISDQYKNPLVYNDSQKKITRTNGSFITDEFSIGDTIQITHGVTFETGIITICQPTYIIYTHISGTAPTDGETDLNIYGISSLNGFRYKYNLLENSKSTSFINSIDGTEMAFVAQGLTVGGGAITANWNNNYKSAYSTISCTIEKIAEVNTSEHYQQFKIIHTFVIAPFALSGEFDNIVNGILPADYAGTKSLKYIAGFEARTSIYNPNNSHAGIDDAMKGDVGYFNEHFNGFIPKEFSLYSVTYKDTDSNTIDALSLQGGSIEILIDSVNGIFSNGNTKFELQHLYLPTDQNRYLNTQTTYFDNFGILKILQIVGSTGTGSGIFTNVVGTYISDTRIKITATVTFTTEQKSILKDQNYIISVLIQDHSKATESSDKMNVLVDGSTYLNNADNPNLLVWNSVKHYEQPYDELTVMGRKDINGWLVDNILTVADFSTVGATLNKVTLKYVVKNKTTLDSQVLSFFNLDVSSYPIDSIGARLAEVETSLNYNLPSTDKRGKATLTMGTVISTTQQYILKIGSRLRWEDYIKLNYVIQQFYDFYDKTKLNNNINEDWHKYNDLADWELLQVIEIEVSDFSNGEITTFQRESEVNAFDFDEDEYDVPRWTGKIETFDSTGNLNGNLSAVENTKIVATFDCAPFSIDTTALYGVISIEPYQQGGQNAKFEVNSLQQPLSGQILLPYSSTPSEMIEIISSSELTLTAYVDLNKLDKSLQYRIYARFGSTCIELVTNVWNMSKTSADAIFNFAKFNNSTILYADSKGDIQLSVNGGNTFINKLDLSTVVQSNWSKFKIQIINETTAYYLYCPSLISNTYTLYKTIDSGETWSIVATIPLTVIRGDSNPMNFYYCFSDDHIIIGNSQKMVKVCKNLTTLQTFTTVFTSTIAPNSPILKSIDFNSNIGIIMTSEGTGAPANNQFIFRSIDYGDTWSLINDIPSELKTYGVMSLECKYVGNNTFVAVCMTPRNIFKSIDNGLTWNLLTLISNDSITSFNAIDSSVFYYGTYLGNIYKTVDGGINWTVEGNFNTGNYLQVLSILMINEQIGFWGGYGQNENLGKKQIIGENCSFISNVTGYLLDEDGTYLLEEDTNKIIL